MTSQAFQLKVDNACSQPKSTIPKAGTSQSNDPNQVNDPGQANDEQEEGTNEKSQLIAAKAGAYCIYINQYQLR